jgi:23S rRNA (uridine2552-2'-O)-methyltransferase
MKPGGKRTSPWMRRHVTDTFVKRARTEGYRSRAAYKLQEIAAKDHLLAIGAVVVDLGAAPGGWSQVAAKAAGPKGTVVAVDLLPVVPIPGVRVLQGDFSDQATLSALETALEGRRVDLVLSDMAPNLTGVAGVDQARGAALVEVAAEFAVKHLKPEGSLLVKSFHGEAFESSRRYLQARFVRVFVRKPGASRDESREVYLLARGVAAAGHSVPRRPADISDKGGG